LLIMHGSVIRSIRSIRRIRTSAPKNRRGRRFGGHARALDGELSMLGRANDEIVFTIVYNTSDWLWMGERMHA